MFAIYVLPRKEGPSETTSTNLNYFLRLYSANLSEEVDFLGLDEVDFSVVG